MDELPPHIKAVQEQFRVKMDAQSRNIEKLHAKALADEIESAQMVDVVAAGEALVLIDEESEAK